jgi:DHA2 family methylenomycin A resistance protein-like MFS transporter
MPVEAQVTARHSIAADSSSAFTLVATSLGFVVVQLDVTIVNVALQRIGNSVGGGIAALQWVVNAYTIVFAGLILTAGVIGDRLGAKRVFISGFAMFTAASVACGAAPNLDILIGARAVQGIGAAILVPCSLALLSHAYHDDAARSKAVGIWAGGAGVALALGPVVGGVLVESIGWRSIFFLNLPIGAVGIWLTARYAPESSRSEKMGFDLPGQLVAILTLAMLAAAFIEGGKVGWTNWFVIADFIASAIGSTIFLVIEAQRESPMLPLGFFRNATFSTMSAIGLMINIAFYGLIFVFSLFFQQQKKFSPLDAGLAFLPMTAAVIVANIAAGRAAAVLGPRPPMIVGQAIFALGCLFLLGTGIDTPYSRMWWQLLAIGAGIGLVVPPMTSALLGTVERQNSGVASGVLNTSRQLGSVIGVALFGSLIADPAKFVAGTHQGLVISAALVLSGCVAAFAFAQGKQRIYTSGPDQPTSQ